MELESLKIKEINEILSNLCKYYPNNASYVSTIDRIESDYVPRHTEVYKTGFQDLFLLITKEQDSYGENEHIISIKFGKAVQKVITSYE